MSTGDIKNNIKQLQHELKAAKFPHAVDVDGFLKGSPKAYLAIYHYLFTTYSTKLNKDIVNSNNELYGKSDMRFMEAVYKILRDMFDYKPQIHREQFFSEGFAERKLIMATDVLRLVGSKYKPLKSSSFRVTTTKEDPVLAQKVVQEPVETTRKIASKSQDFVGAVVLPVKKSPGSFKIPKTVLKTHYSSSSASSMDGNLYPRIAPGDPIKANTQEEKERPDKDLDGGDSSSSKSNSVGKLATGPQFVMPDVLPKIMDSLKPILTKLSDRLDRMDSLVQTLQQPVAKKTQDEPSAGVDNISASKWMNDLAFKMDTLTSRVVLIENRLTLLEAKLDREPIKTAKTSFVDSKKPPIGPGNRRSEGTQNGYHMNPRGKAVIGEDDDEESDYGENENVTVTDDVQVKIIRAEPEQKPIHDSNQLYTIDDDSLRDFNTANSFKLSCQNPSEMKSSSESKAQAAYKPVDNYSHSLFETFSSPIQKQASDFDTSWGVDQSLASQFSSQEDPRDLSSLEDRRASTPTHLALDPIQLALDTSTLERVNRINQLMAETQKLFS